MSAVDTILPESLREQYVEEVAAWLPAFLSGASVERLDALAQVSDLLQVRLTDLTSVLAIHLLMQPAIQAFLSALPAGLREPATNSTRPRKQTRSISGGVDWAATMRTRATASPIEGGFVTRPAVRIFDVPANHVLAWTVNELTRLVSVAIAVTPGGAPWFDSLERAEKVVQSAKRTQWLRGLTTQRPTARELSGLEVSRVRFYKVLLRDAADLLRRYEEPTPEDVTALLIQRWFEPSRDWQLFELTVLLRIQKALATLGVRQRVRPLGYTRAASASYRLPTGALVRLWYQGWPDTAGVSEQLDAARHYSIATGGSRPDILVEVQDGPAAAAIVLELKATRSGDYLGAGLLQLLAYLRDRPALFGKRPRSAWLVAPAPATFASEPPEHRQLWVVDADDVADAVVAAVAELSIGMPHTMQPAPS